MSGTMGKVFVFLLTVLGLFLWIGDSVTELTGGERTITAAVEVNPEGGEIIFWGRGRCFTCHSVGDRGSAVRGPNQGQFGEKFPEPIGIRAVQRARERSEKTSETYTRTDYIVESLAEPGAYVVSGYKNEMAVVYAPPISLNFTEIKAVITYLQSQGGDVDLESLDNPSELTQRFFAKIAAASEAGGGDPGAGEVVFEDNCEECHTLDREAGDLGPGLGGIAGKGLTFISDAILKPLKAITPGYETYVVVTNEGRKFTGLLARDEADEIDIVRQTGETVTIARAEIKEIGADELQSIMPDDLSEALTVKDFQDLLAFLLMQKDEGT